MTKISALRQLVDSGFTIANRKGLSKLVGNEELSRLLSKYRECKPDQLRFKFPNQDKELSIVKFRLTNTNEGYRLSLNTEIRDSSSKGVRFNFNSSEINVDAINKKLAEHVENTAQHYKNSGQLPANVLEENNTMEKLFSEKFKVKPHLNKDGYYITTIIDKKTGEPVNAYIKCLKTNRNSFEQWGIFVKNSSGEYEQIGLRKYHLDPKSKIIHTGFMESRDGRDMYSGIGIRLHQIAIERMFQKGYKNIYINSEPNAFAFHYKSGFRAPNYKDITTKEEIERITNLFLKQGLSHDEISRALNLKISGSKIEVNAQAFERLVKNLYLKNNGNMLGNDYLLPMELDKEHLKMWKNLIDSQPIICRSDVFSGFRDWFMSLH